MSTRQLVKIALLGTLFLGIGLTNTNASFASVLTWDVTKADSDAYGQYSGGHAFSGVVGNQYVFDGDGLLVEDLGAGTAHLTGTLVLPGNHDNSWGVDVWFKPTFLNQTFGPKKELIPGAYIENAGPVDPGTWRFYNFDLQTGAKLTGLNDNAGEFLFLTQRPDDLSHPFQVGYGANGKNSGIGASAWFGYVGTSTGWHGDINVDLEAHTVPEPATMALFGSGLLGAFVRRRKKT